VTGAGGSLDPKGPYAEEIYRLWWILLVLGAAVFIAVIGFLIVGLIRRHRSDTPPQEDPLAPTRWIVAGGIFMPVVVLAVVLGVSIDSTWVLDTRVPRDAMVIEVTGHQWWWEVQYEGRDFATANGLHIPVGEPVLIRLRSEDVIHSFWVPQLAGRIDALPDHPNELVIQADEPGEYGGRCAEFCGLQHTNMAVLVVAENGEDLSERLEAQESEARISESEEAGRGAVIFLSHECAECHTIKGTSADGHKGPDLTHVASRARLGATVIPTHQISCGAGWPIHMKSTRVSRCPISS
jgi:cytochrome c oxidase subunit 2